MSTETSRSFASNPDYERHAYRLHGNVARPGCTLMSDVWLDWARIAMIVAENVYRKGFTLDPETCLVFDAYSEEDCRTMYRLQVESDPGIDEREPLYFIGVTNNIGTEVNDWLMRVFSLVSKKPRRPQIGFWRDRFGVPYLDVVIARQFINPQAAMEFGKRHGQEWILAVWADGSHEHIETDQEHVL
ncbi:MAG: hypothetical protein MPI95_03940 [Nitrosopumilus sp.]|nr:hypothetical protein [Nitrosopumilus sp.]CAI9832375.1 hypothetical protein IBTHAUMO2_750004 [Nitrosopumilaceae archaeon]